MRSSSPFIASAVRAITGMSRVASSAFRSAHACSPSMPGSWISIRTRSGCSRRANAMPASASVARSTAWPADFSRKVAKVMLAGLSSITSTVAISGNNMAAGHGPANFGDKAVLVEASLFHDRHHITTESFAVLGCDVFCGDHEDRYAGCGGVFVEGSDHVEAAHFGHHQVEHDQNRNLPSRGIDRLTAAVCAQNGAGQAKDPSGNQLHCFGVVIDHEDLESLTLRDRKQTKSNERVIQLLPGYWLLHDASGAKRVALLRIRHD